MNYLDTIETAANAATQGDWISTGIVIGVPADGGLDYIIEATSKNHDADMAYLEALQPKVALRLVKRLREFEAPIEGSLTDHRVAAAIRALRESGHAVVIWTPDEIPEAVSISSLESIVIMRGNDYLEAHEGA